jgi:hypothetical protein
MDNKNERRRILFSAAKFKRLPMAEKLAYLREAFGALGNGLQVVDRRRSPPAAAALERKSLFRGATTRAGDAGLLSRPEFDLLTLEKKLEYLAVAFRELQRSMRRGRVFVPARRDVQRPQTFAK